MKLPGKILLASYRGLPEGWNRRLAVLLVVAVLTTSFGLLYLRSKVLRFRFRRSQRRSAGQPEGGMIIRTADSSSA